MITVSWGSYKNERWSSKKHYIGKNGRTLCGKRIPDNRTGLGDSWDMCEKCVNIAKTTPQPMNINKDLPTRKVI